MDLVFVSLIVGFGFVMVLLVYALGLLQGGQ